MSMVSLRERERSARHVGAGGRPWEDWSEDGVHSRAEGVAQQLGRWASSVSEAVGSREQQQDWTRCAVGGRSGMRMETVWSGWCLSGLGLFAIT